MKYVRSIAFILALALCLALISGCGQAQQSSEENGNMQAEQQQELKIFCIETGFTLFNEALLAYRRAHPTVNVEVEYYTYDSGISLEDAITSLNASLIAGKGPDVIMLDGLPAQSYINSGVLMDMSVLVDTSDIYEALLEPFETPSGIFALPASLEISCLLGSGLSRVNSLNDYVQMIVNDNYDEELFIQAVNNMQPLAEAERPITFYDSYFWLLMMLSRASYPAFIQNNEVNAEAISEYYESLYAICDKFNLFDADGGELPRREFSGELGDSGISFTPLLNVGLALQGTISIGADTFNLGINNLCIYQCQEEFDIYLNPVELKLFPGVAQGTWQPKGLMGISAGTKQPQLAAQFIQTMLSPNLQGMGNSTGGFRTPPVTKEGAKQQWAFYEEIYGKSFEDTYSPLIRQCKSPAITDDYVLQVINTYSQEIYMNKANSKQAAENAKKDLEMYVREKN